MKKHDLRVHFAMQISNEIPGTSALRIAQWFNGATSKLRIHEIREQWEQLKRDVRIDLNRGDQTLKAAQL